MTDHGTTPRRRVHLPQSFRVRLSLAYAALFLAAGAALLALTYGLVASSLPRPSSSTLTSTQLKKLAVVCQSTVKSEKAAPHKGKPHPRALPSSCQKEFQAGAQVAASGQRAQTLHNLLLFSLVGLGAMTLAAGGIGWFMAGRVLDPVRRITLTAQRASERHLGERLNATGPRDELRELADTFDEMLDRLDAAFANQRRFVADASHELRTPLTVIRTAVDVALAKPNRSIEQLEAMALKVRRSVDRAEALTAALLTMAMSDRGVVTGEPFDLATAAEDALETAAPQIARLGLRVDTDLAPAEIVADPRLVERLVANLVDNAVRHNLPGGWVRVRTTAAADDASVEIANSGPRVDEELVATLFEPFRQAAARSGEGFGLGLAIVKSVADAHGATVEARSLEEGGLSVAVHFGGARRAPDPGPDQAGASGVSTLAGWRPST